MRSPPVILAVSIVLCGTLAHRAVGQDAVRWRRDLTEARIEADRTRRLVLIHFWNESCGPCVQLDRDVFSQPQFATRLEADFVPVKVNTQSDPEVARAFGVTRIPTDAVITPAGQVVSKTGCPARADQYVAHLQQIVAGHHRTSSQFAGASTREPRGTGYDRYASSPSDSADPNRRSHDARYAERPRDDAPARYAERPEVEPAQQRSAYSGYRPETTRDPIDGYRSGAPDHATSRRADETAPADYRASTFPASRQNAPDESPRVSRGNDPRAARPVAGVDDDYARRRFAEIEYRGDAGAPDRNAAVPNHPSSPQIPHRPSASQGRTPRSEPERSTQGPPQRQGEPSPRDTTPRADDARYANDRDPRRNSQHAPAAAPNHRPHPAEGLDGYCPVRMVDHHSLVAGDRHWGATHQERTYLFAGPDEQRRFLADPDRYAPVLAGNDPVRWFHEHKLVPGTRIHGLKYGGQIFLFADEHALKAFEASPERYADEARQAMRPRGNARR